MSQGEIEILDGLHCCALEEVVFGTDYHDVVAVIADIDTTENNSGQSGAVA